MTVSVLIGLGLAFPPAAVLLMILDHIARGREAKVIDRHLRFEDER